MPPEFLDYMTNVIGAVEAYLNAHQHLGLVLQEGFDRDFDDLIPTLDYPLPGDLDHVDAGEIAAMFAAFTALEDTMNANGRANIRAMTAVLRSWTR